MYYNYTIKTIDVEIVSDVLVLTVPSMALCNRKMLSIKICQDIPTEITADMPIKIKIENGGRYSVIGCNANKIYADQVRKFGTYCLNFATDTEKFIYKGGWRLCRTAHEFDCIPIPTESEA